MSAAIEVTRCRHCNGAIEHVIMRGGREIDRCVTCGREPSTGAVTTRNGSYAVPRPTPDTPCPVEHCPGKLDGQGVCPCCAKRRAWAEAHAPKRKCEICEGEIAGRGRIKYCPACKPLAQRLYTATYEEKNKGGRS